MTSDSPSSPTSSNNSSSSLPGSTNESGVVDAVYEVALDPARYDELVTQWHSQLTDSADAIGPFAEHFRRASTILERIAPNDWDLPSARSSNRTGETHTTGLSLPELILSTNGEILAVNSGAAALLSARVGLSINQLDLTSDTRATLLQLAQNLVISAAGPDDTRILRINRTGDDRPLVVLLNRCEHQHKTAVLVRCAEIIWPDALGPLLARAFDLTNAECDIVQALVAGQNASTISAARGTSKETVRTQIKELLSKTGTHSQLELIRMTIGFSMMAQHADARSKPSVAPHDFEATPLPGYRSHTMSLPDGRLFEWVEYGPRTGKPVLVFHDEVCGDAFVLPLLRLAPEFRMLVPVRYGYGETSLNDRREPLERWRALLDDIKHILDEVTTDSRAMPILAHGNGIYFACRMAHVLPDRCHSITALAASLPRPADATDDHYSRYASFVNTMGRLAPAMLRFAVQAGFAMYARVGTARFLEKVYGDSKIDRELFARASCLHDLEHGGRLTLAQGYRGFLGDEQALQTDWTDLFLSTPVPIRIVLGAEDQPSRAERANRLSEASNQIELIPAPKAGFFACFSAAEQVLSALGNTRGTADSSRPLP